MQVITEEQGEVMYMLCLHHVISLSCSRGGCVINAVAVISDVGCVRYNSVPAPLQALTLRGNWLIQPGMSRIMWHAQSADVQPIQGKLASRLP